ncbi:MAG: hypothetical protein ACRD08_07255 [Acidimicrobiales bacterium]
MTSRAWRVPRALPALLLACLPALAACSRAVKPEGFAATVPEAPRRLMYLADTGAVADLSTQLAQALEQAVCLLRSERALECREPDPDVSACNTRPVQEIEAALKPAFDAIPRVRMTSAATINADLRALIPGSVSTTEVWDARRDHLCREWRSADGACVAVKVDKVWLLLHAQPGGDGRVDRLEVFLAERVCADDLRDLR